MQQSSIDHALVCARDIMTAHLCTVRMDDSVLVARDQFDRHKFHHVLVLEGRRVVGVVSDRDILKRLSPFVGNRLMERPQDLNTLKQRIHQVMTRHLVTIGPDDLVGEAAKIMISERVSCLPVVDDNGHPLGILTIRDILTWAAGALDAG